MAPVAEVGHHYVMQATASEVLACAGRGETEPTIPPYVDYDAYVKDGGHRPPDDLRAGRVSKEDILKALDDFSLRGLGGAGFPTGRKWRAVLGEPGPRLMAINGDEGEPGTFKDRFYLLRDLHRFLEGMLIGAHIVDATDVYIYIRDEYPAVLKVLPLELAKLPKGGPILHIRRGAGAYICGGAVFPAGKHRGQARPAAAQAAIPISGWAVRPAHVDQQHRDVVLGARHRREGVGWWSSHGRNGRHGLRSYSGSGPRQESRREARARRPDGPRTDRRVLRRHGRRSQIPRLFAGRRVRRHPASFMERHSPRFRTPGKYGCFIGSAAVIILSDQDSVKGAALNLMRFFEDESCSASARPAGLAPRRRRS